MVYHMEIKNENFLDAIDFDLWDYVQNGPFVPIHFIYNEVVKNIFMDHRIKIKGSQKILK